MDLLHLFLNHYSNLDQQHLQYGSYGEKLAELCYIHTILLNSSLPLESGLYPVINSGSNGFYSAQHPENCTTNSLPSGLATNPILYTPTDMKLLAPQVHHHHQVILFP